MKRMNEESADDFDSKRSKTDFLSLYEKRGEGIYGNVFRCKIENDHKWRAIKIFKLNDDPQHEDETFTCDMPAVIRDLLIGGTCNEMRSGVIQCVNRKQGHLAGYAIVSELGHCTLKQAAPGLIPIHAVRIFGKRLLNHLLKIHSYGAMHRDLKPDNILMTWRNDDIWPELEIIDYGLSFTGSSSCEENVVTLWWRAPEVLLGLEHNQSLDIWAIGVILLNLCSFESFSDAQTTKDLLNDVWGKLGYPSDNKFAQSTKSPTGICVESSHSSILTVISSALKVNPSERLSASELLKLPFWEEIPDDESQKLADSWIRSVSKIYNKEPPNKLPYKTFPKNDFIIYTPLDSSFVESDSLWVCNALNGFTDEHLHLIKKISFKALWTQKIFEQCVLITDRTLHSSIFPPVSNSILICAAAYVTCCLHSDKEPSPSQLMSWCGCTYPLPFMYRAVYTVLAAMNFRLLPIEVCESIKTLPSWEKIKFC